MCGLRACFNIKRAVIKYDEKKKLYVMKPGRLWRKGCDRLPMYEGMLAKTKQNGRRWEYNTKRDFDRTVDDSKGLQIVKKNRPDSVSSSCVVSLRPLASPRNLSSHSRVHHLSIHPIFLYLFGSSPSYISIRTGLSGLPFQWPYLASFLLLLKHLP